MKNKKEPIIILSIAVILILILISLFLDWNIFNSPFFRKLNLFNDTKYYGKIPVEFGNIKFPDRVFRVHNISTYTFSKGRKEKFEILKKELDKYSLSLLEKTLDIAYYMDKLYIDCIGKGGTRSLKDRSIYFVNLSAFHAELSSLIFQQNKTLFPIEEWREFSKGRYTSNAFYLTSKGGILNYEDEYLQNGFMNRYGQSDLENDFNEIYKLIYADDSRQEEFVKKYKRIAGKVKIVKQFMKDIDFNEK